MTRPPRIRERRLLHDPLPDLHPVVARVLAARGIKTRDEIDPALTGLHPPMLTDVDVAARRLLEALRTGENILIVGDFDADGATSVALVMRALRAFGHDNVGYLVPNRFEYGYGLTPELVEVATGSAPGLILTVDNGISSHDGVASAHARGIDVIITDHHLPGNSLPPAQAVVNPNRSDCDFPSSHLAGVGVAFYLLAALRGHLRAAGWFAEQGSEAPSMATFLDLVALGTVADVVRLDRNNRILVEQGLRRIRAGQCCPGILALLQVAKRQPARATAGDLGYAVAPRLNAAGRLADMALGIETLLATDADTARNAAKRLDELNRERRSIETEMKAQADVELDRLQAQLAQSESLPAGVVLHDERWHQGVSGILAGRVREMVYRPTVILASDGNGSLKGSCRSIPDLHIRDVLAAVDTAHPGLILRFGGHAMAAGLTLAPENLDSFRAAFAQSVSEALDGVIPERLILTDGELEAGQLSLDTAEALRAAGPWGAGFPEPLFEGTFQVLDHRIVGEHHLKLTVQSPDGTTTRDAIAFHAPPSTLREPGRHLRLVYRLDVNEFRGRRTPQLLIEYMERR